MSDETKPLPSGLALLRVEFPPHQISKLPKGTKAQNECPAAEKVNCKVCGGWHHPRIIHLDYVGHAAMTDRLLDADPGWFWEPLAINTDGLPVLDGYGGMWIKLTVCGVTRIGYGNADGKTGGNAIKEVIGDALRNAAMRFGAALDLWHKGDLHVEDDPTPPPPPAAKPAATRPTTPVAATEKDASPRAVAARIVASVASGEAAAAADAMAGWAEQRRDAVWALIDPATQKKLNDVWPSAISS